MDEQNKNSCKIQTIGSRDFNYGLKGLPEIPLYDENCSSKFFSRNLGLPRLVILIMPYNGSWKCALPELLVWGTPKFRRKNLKSLAPMVWILQVLKFFSTFWLIIFRWKPNLKAGEPQISGENCGGTTTIIKRNAWGHFKPYWKPLWPIGEGFIFSKVPFFVQK